jgi:hypothetical protein
MEVFGRVSIGVQRSRAGLTANPYGLLLCDSFCNGAGMHPAAVGPVAITGVPAKAEFGLYIIAGVLGG